VVDTVNFNNCHGVIVNAEDEIWIARKRNHPESMKNPVGNHACTNAKTVPVTQAVRNIDNG
jgi:hypothetical protein